ncbi:replication/maintenance protein RepL [Peptostreptococcus stomatis]|uniref:replication/maintenance protein RepL n=1 Tax=Peptostreptococcus stomatis TaxID=341694 RepID=UPI001A57820A|nr:replication/maintenance protein RepL [Peptostreptococcus stomatis]MBL6466347.1 replication/maintenance protein RepL [Peptostreptococcus stomatis]
MFDLEHKPRKLNKDRYSESQMVNYNKEHERFINISPNNYIRSLKDTSTKKAMIPMVLISLMDKNNKIYMTLDDLSIELDYPKTALSVLFGQYKKMDFLKKVRNGLYMVNPLVSYRGSKYERDKLIKEYNTVYKGKK